MFIFRFQMVSKKIRKCQNAMDVPYILKKGGMRAKNK